MFQVLDPTQFPSYDIVLQGFVIRIDDDRVDFTRQADGTFLLGFTVTYWASLRACRESLPPMKDRQRTQIPVAAADPDPLAQAYALLKSEYTNTVDV